MVLFASARKVASTVQGTARLGAGFFLLTGSYLLFTDCGAGDHPRQWRIEMRISMDQAEQICRRYGADLRYYLPEFEQANENDGAHGKTAVQYFDCYVAESERCNTADGLAAAEFARNAY